jgi:hypothetical protein
MLYASTTSSEISGLKDCVVGWIVTILTLYVSGKRFFHATIIMIQQK